MRVPHRDPSLRAIRRTLVLLVVSAPLTLAAASAAAQDPPPPPPPPTLGGQPPPAFAPAAGEGQGERDGVRFRGGVSAVGGTMFVSGYSGGLFGADGRFGVQINNLLGVYATPHLVFGPVTTGGSVNTVIGVFAGTADVDATFFDHLYVGAGGGFGVVNNPTGPVLHLRVGGYPIVGTGENGYRRKALQVGVDSRFYFLSSGGASLTVGEITGGIGFEAF